MSDITPERRESVARKIKALLAKAENLRAMDTEDAANEAEALWEKAQVLIVENQISDELLRMASEGKGTAASKPETRRLYLNFDFPYLKSRCYLASLVGMAMGVMTRVANDGSYVLYIGFPEDITAAWEMFQAIEPQMLLNGKRRVADKAHHEMFDYSTKSGHVSAKSYMITYCEGFSLRVFKRLSEVRRMAAEDVVVAEGSGPEQQGKVTGELVLAERQDAVETYYKGLYPVKLNKDGSESKRQGGAWKKPQASGFSSGAYNHGSQDGEKARLGRQTSLGNTRKALN